ncbi:MAG: hypothetical protein LBQ79_00115 [Deltaproteobacteria bacterium]|nr:hypothetical protein [Deltaproteobacteria bacterium]
MDTITSEINAIIGGPHGAASDSPAKALFSLLEAGLSDPTCKDDIERVRRAYSKVLEDSVPAGQVATDRQALAKAASSSKISETPFDFKFSIGIVVTALALIASIVTPIVVHYLNNLTDRITIFETGINGRISDLQTNMNDKFAAVNDKFATVNDKFADLGKRIDGVEARLGKLEDTVMLMLEDIARLLGSAYGSQATGAGRRPVPPKGDRVDSELPGHGGAAEPRPE